MQLRHQKRESSAPFFDVCDLSTTASTVTVHDLKAVAHLDPRPPQHDGSRTVLFRRHGDRPLDDGFLQPAPRYPEVQVDAGENRRYRIGALGLDLRFATGDSLATLP